MLTACTTAAAVLAYGWHVVWQRRRERDNEALHILAQDSTARNDTIPVVCSSSVIACGVQVILYNPGDVEHERDDIQDH